jgi:N-acetylglucosaminyldiphosphoundecaprenol N-acetyl-beta-D-mannosaminyltransferase
LDIERIDLLGVPLDIISAETLEQFINELLIEPAQPAPSSKKDAGKNIVLLSLWDLLRARRPGDYRDFVLNAALVIPISKSLTNGARFLTGKTPLRYMPFDFVISVLTHLESHEETVYIVGGKPAVLRKTEQNVRETFPKLRVVGRYPGTMRKQDEDNLLVSIRKCSPSLLLVGRGVRGGERWLSRNSEHFPKGLRLWASDIFEIFAEKRRRPSRFAFDHGLEWVGFSLHKPFYIFRVFPFIFYNILLLITKIRRKH